MRQELRKEPNILFLLNLYIINYILEKKALNTVKTFEFCNNLYYFNARWYDPNTGRFTTEDPIRDGINWFVYASNNPLRFVDPTGLAPFPTTLKTVFSLFAVDSLVTVGVSPVTQSLYLQKYQTVRGREAGYKKVVGAVGVLPHPVLQGIGLLAAVMPESDVDPSIVVYSERKEFLTGASSELDKIKDMLSDIEQDFFNSDGESYKKYLEEQKRLLGKEIEKNEDYDVIQKSEIEATAEREGVSVSDTRSTTPDVTTDSRDYLSDFDDVGDNE